MHKYHNKTHNRVYSKFLLYSISVFFLGIVGLSYGQVSDEGCPSCVNISPGELDLYKKLFSLIIWADDTTYDHDSVIHLSGYLRPENNFHPVTVKVTNPVGNVVLVQQLTPNPDGNFSLDMDTSSPLWKKDGMYIIQAQSGPQTRLFKAQVELTPSARDQSQCMSSEIKIDATNGAFYCLPFSVQDGQIRSVGGKLNIEDKTLLIDVQGTGVSSVVVEIPRNILDSKTPDGTDTEFMVFYKGEPVAYEQVDSTEESRSLKLQYPTGEQASFEIVGSHVIPEFGLVTVVVLGAAITSMIFFSKKFVNLPGRISL